MEDIKKVKAAILTNKTGVIKHQLGVVEPSVSIERTFLEMPCYLTEVATKIEIGFVYTIPEGEEAKYHAPRAEIRAKNEIMKYLYGDVRNELLKALHQIESELSFVDSVGLQILRKLCSELHTIDEG